MRILVVDDNIDAGETLSTLLGVLGHDSLFVASGAEALTRLEAFRPALVFCDISMPDMDGYEVAREIYRRCGEGVPRLIAHSGFGTAEDRERARQAGFHHHLTKPLKVTELIQILGQGPG